MMSRGRFLLGLVLGGWTLGCGSDPTNIALVYNVVYSIEIEGVQNEVRSVTWTATDGTNTVVNNPPSGWTLPMLAFSGQPVGVRLEGSVSNGSITLHMSAVSEGSGGVRGEDNCSDTTGILQNCILILPVQTLP